MDETQRKKTLRMVPYGLYLMGVREPEVADVSRDLNAFLASWVTQVSFKPPMLVVAVRRDGHSLGMVKRSGVFTLNVLASDQKELAQTFMKTLDVNAETMSGVRYERAPRTGCPILPDTPGHVECEVRHVYEGENDHAVFVAEVVEAANRRDAKPLTHAETGWHYAG